MNKQIVIVGEAWGRYEEEKGRPFVGPSGALLDQFLAAAGIARSECYLTNVFNFRPPNNDIKSLCGPAAYGIPDMPALDTGKYVSAEYGKELTRLRAELDGIRPNLIIALGGTACWAILRDRRIKKLRGAPASGYNGFKVLPTYHPAAVLREFKLRPTVFSDFRKAASERAFPEIRRPKRELWLYPTIEDIHEFDKYIQAAEYLSVDIETWAGQITCIGFAPSADLALVVPFVWHGSSDGNYWPSLREELDVWSVLRGWLTSGKRIVGQNFLYDANYLWARYGIPIKDIFQDTMLTHHAMQPELEKSLGYLGSIYTTEPSWKFMRSDIETLKKED